MKATRRSLLSLGPIACLASAQSNPPALNTIILVRHAETAGDTRTAKDPDLSPTGRARAQALAKLLAAAGVTHLFASEYQRTQATLAPLAKAFGIEVVVRPARDAAAQVAALEALKPGSVVVVAGHSNTVPALVQSLGGRFPQPAETPAGPGLIAHGEYGRAFVLSGSSKAARTTLELRYG